MRAFMIPCQEKAITSFPDALNRDNHRTRSNGAEYVQGDQKTNQLHTKL